MLASSLSSTLGSSWSGLAWVALSAVGIYVAVLAVVRINGLRSFSKMSSVDFMVTIAIGSVVASTASTSTPLAAGVAAVVALFGIQYAATTLRRHDRGWLDNQPEVLMVGRDLRDDVMRRRRVSVGDVKEKLREADVASLDEVRCVILETTGDVSVLTRDRDRPLDPWIVDNVAGADLVLAAELAEQHR